MTLSVAIVGAGPAGFYTAEALLETAVTDVRVDMIERLPTPFGLIRAGVAPDHQSTKRVSRRFEQTALRETVRYYGNVEVGRDVTVDELLERYDAVILAHGSPADRRLGIPGEHLKGVHGSAGFVGWYNGHPDFRDLDPLIDSPTAVVIGNGNVALDVARVLVKTEREMAESDLPDYAAQLIHPSPVTDVHMVGRRGPVEAKFTNVELREMGRLEQVHPVIDAALLPESVGELEDDRGRRLKEKNLATLKEFTTMADDGRPKRVHFRFFLSPVEILGSERVEGVRFERTRYEDGRIIDTGEFEVIPCGLVVAAIGYRSEPMPGVPFDDRQGLVPSNDGRVAPKLYAVGWAKRGPIGVISTNRTDGEACAAQILADFPGGVKPGRDAFEALLARRRVRAITYDDWRTIEAAEVAAASGGAPRRKFTTLQEMLAVLETTRPNVPVA